MKKIIYCLFFGLVLTFSFACSDGAHSDENEVDGDAVSGLTTAEACARLSRAPVEIQECLKSTGGEQKMLDECCDAKQGCLKTLSEDVALWKKCQPEDSSYTTDSACDVYAKKNVKTCLGSKGCDKDSEEKPKWLHAVDNSKAALRCCSDVSLAIGAECSDKYTDLHKAVVSSSNGQVR